MRIENDIYISSSGRKFAIGDMPYPYLVNARNKAEDEGDQAALRILDAEVTRRTETTL